MFATRSAHMASEKGGSRPPATRRAVGVIGIVALVAGNPIATGCRHSERLCPELETALRTIRNGAYDQAREMLAVLAERDPDNPAILANLGVAHWRLGETELAVAALSRAMSSVPTDQRPAQIMARIFIDLRNTEGALAVLQDVPDSDARTIGFKALAHYRAGRMELALQELNRARELAPDAPPTLYNLAVLQRDARRDAEAALRYYARFREVARTHPLAQRAGTDFLALNPHFEHMRQPPSPSSPSQMVPSDPPAALRAAREAVSRNDFEAAVVRYREAIAERPDMPDALWELAELFLHRLDFKSRAEELQQRFRRLFPDDPRSAQITLSDETPEQRSQLSFDAGMLHYREGRWAAAAAAFRRALEAEPGSAGIAFNLGLAEHRRGSADDAIAAFQLAVKHDPDMPDPLYMIGLIERERGHTGRAVAHMNQLLRRHPDHAPSHLLLGMIYADNNRPREATTHFEQAIALDPDSPAARQAREWLDGHAENRGRRIP